MTAARIILSLITSIGVAVIGLTGYILLSKNNQEEVPITVFSNRRRQNRHDDPLEENDDPSEYQCSKCLQMGFGRRLECRSRKNCGNEYHPYQTHPKCSKPPSTVRHPLLNRCVFEFRDSGGDDDKLCEACGVGTSGCYYQCMGHCDKVIHLYCSKLPQTMNVGEIRLVLNRSMTSECSNCYPGLRTSDERKWGYKSLNTDRQIHIYCVKQSFPKILSDPDQKRNIIRSIVPVDGAEDLIAMTKAIGSVLT